MENNQPTMVQELELWGLESESGQLNAVPPFVDCVLSVKGPVLKGDLQAGRAVWLPKAFS